MLNYYNPQKSNLENHQVYDVNHQSLEHIKRLFTKTIVTTNMCDQELRKEELLLNTSKQSLSFMRYYNYQKHLTFYVSDPLSKDQRLWRIYSTKSGLAYICWPAYAKRQTLRSYAERQPTKSKG